MLRSRTLVSTIWHWLRAALSHHLGKMAVLLILLFAWTNSAVSTITITVSENRCAAKLATFDFISDCPQQAAELIVLAIPDGLQQIDTPLQQLSDHTQLVDITVENERFNESISLRGLGDRPLLNRLEGEAVATLYRHSLQPAESTTITLRIKRPEGIAGIAVVAADGRGEAFIVDASVRRGVWWVWQAGGPVEPLAGVPWQRSFIAQLQSQLQRWLAPAFAALTILACAQAFFRSALADVEATMRWRFPTRLRPYERYLVVAATFGNFVFALVVARWYLEGIPHVQDSVTNLFQAQTLARGELWAPPPIYPEFFVQEFLTVFAGKWFGQYLPGFPALLVPGVWAGTPWVINPFLAALTTPLLYWLARDWGGRRVARWSLLLLVTSPFFLVMSGSFMVHAAELFWATLFLVTWRRYWYGRGWRWGFWSGVSMGVMALTRPVTMLALLLPYALVVWLGQRPWRQPDWFRRSLGPVLLATPFLILTLLYQFQLTGDPWQDPRLIQRPFDTIGFGPEIGEGPNVFRLGRSEAVEPAIGSIGQTLAAYPVVIWQYDDNLPPRGHSPARGLFNVGDNWRSLEQYLFGWLPIFTFIPLWLTLLHRRPTRRILEMLLPVCWLLLIYISFWATGRMYGPRYYYTLIPPLILLTAWGIIQLEHKLKGRFNSLIIKLLFAGLITANMLLFLPNYLQATRDFNFVDGELAASVAAQVEKPALVFVAADPQAWWEYGSFFSANTPWLDGEIVYARDLGSRANERLSAVYPGYNLYRYDGAVRPINR